MLHNIFLYLKEWQSVFPLFLIQSNCNGEGEQLFRRFDIRVPHSTAEQMVLDLTNCSE